VRPCGPAKGVASKICLRRYNQRLQQPSPSTLQPPPDIFWAWISGGLRRGSLLKRTALGSPPRTSIVGAMRDQWGLARSSPGHEQPS
jgi:hypothetical protein